MGVPGSSADPQRAELMGRVGVISYRNDRQTGLKGNVDGHDQADEWRYGAEDDRVGQGMGSNAVCG